MRIVIIGPAHPYRGGIAAFNERLARQFAIEGHEVWIETFILQYPSFLFPGKTQYTTDPAPKGVRIRRSVNSVNPLNWFATGRRIKKERPDLVIARFWIPFLGAAIGSIGRIVKRNRHTTIVGLTDNIIPHEKKPADNLLTSWFINSCDGIVAMSESVLNDLDRFSATLPRKLGPHPIYDHYGKIFPRSEALAMLSLDHEYRYLLFFGLIRDYKGLDLLIDAMADGRIAGMKVKLLVAGEFYADEAFYRDQVRKSGVEDNIIFTGRYIPEEEVAAFFNACDMVVQPYRSATQSGVTQIAYHFHKPMLVTNVGGLPEIVPHLKAGYVCPPDSQPIADAIVDFYRNNRMPEFEKFVENEKKRFSWPLFTRLFYELMNELNDKGNNSSH